MTADYLASRDCAWASSVFYEIEIRTMRKADQSEYKERLLAALVRRPFGAMRRDIPERFKPSTVGNDIREQYTISMATAEAISARAVASPVPARWLPKPIPKLARI